MIEKGVTMAIEIIKFKSYEKNTLKGFIDLRLTTIGLEIRQASLHEKAGSRWISLPSKPYQDADGTQKWSYILKFYDEAKSKQFQKAVIQALDKYKGKRDA